MTTNYETAANFGKDFRKEIVPIMKSKGFNLSVSSTKGSYYNDGKLNVKITKVPTNFPVWKDEYSRWQLTDKEQKLLNRIEIRIETKLNHELDLSLQFEYDRNSIPFIEYETENENG